MSEQRRSVPIEHFEAFYRTAQDPYLMNSRWYERRKREITVAVLPRERYDHGLEVACGEGALTHVLAPRVRSLVATEGSPTALARARASLDGVPNVEVRSQVLPGPPPTGPYDLIVVAEVGYYFDSDDLDRVRDSLLSELAVGGDLVAVHWRPSSPDYPLDGDRVHEQLAGAEGLVSAAHYEDDDFVLDVWRRPA